MSIGPSSVLLGDPREIPSLHSGLSSSHVGIWALWCWDLCACGVQPTQRTRWNSPPSRYCLAFDSFSSDWTWRTRPVCFAVPSLLLELLCIAGLLSATRHGKCLVHAQRPSPVSSLLTSFNSFWCLLALFRGDQGQSEVEGVCVQFAAWWCWGQA